VTGEFGPSPQHIAGLQPWITMVYAMFFLSPVILAYLGEYQERRRAGSLSA
jgi:hypothetical protein